MTNEEALEKASALLDDASISVQSNRYYGSKTGVIRLDYLVIGYPVAMSLKGNREMLRWKGDSWEACFEQFATPKIVE